MGFGVPRPSLSEPVGRSGASRLDDVVTHADFEGEKAEYGLDVDPEQVMLFDPETGRQIGSSTAVRRKKFGG